MKRILSVPLVLLFVFTTPLFGQTKPNIVFIEVDDLTYTYASPWGCRTARTPTLDRLASEGFVFDQAMCQGVMCGPSRNSLITGRYPHQLGFYQNGDLRKLPKDSWTLPKALQDAGYHTAWIGKSHLKPYFARKSDADTFQPFFGFDHAVHTLGRVLLGRGEDDGGDSNAPNPYMQHLRDRGLIAQYEADVSADRNSTLPEDDYLDGWFTRLTEDFVAGYQSEKPLFLWVNYSVPHGPYDVADAYHQPFAHVSMPGVSKPTNFTHPESLIQRTKAFRKPELALHEQRGFHANIHFMDSQVRRVLDALQHKGMLDNTWIVFFSDHGVMQGAHGLIHKHTLFRQITQPSLIIRPPGGTGGGKRFSQPVELLDLLPTVLDLTGTAKQSSPNGVSLLPLLSGSGEFSRHHAFAEIEDWIVVTDGNHRLIHSVNGEPPLLFDDQTDPENLTNIAASHSDIVTRLEGMIDKWLRETGPRLPPKSN
ncbi:MAG: sulfatase-like hydrolase/transferase [Planctomycetaceae bacterium]|nr:sulfatase-like hydrolase/transferase [Planctomycetaceae bacterium]